MKRQPRKANWVRNLAPAFPPGRGAGQLIPAFVAICLATGCAHPAGGVSGTGRGPGVSAASPDGAGNLAPKSSVAPKSAALADYQNAVVAAIKERWYGILKDRGPWGSGVVKVEFVIHSSGAISDLKYLKNEMGGFFGGVCLEAVSNSAPFSAWPPEMTQEFQSDCWKVSFTFWYNEVK
jgi:hypothetical protein